MVARGDEGNGRPSKRTSKAESGVRLSRDRSVDALRGLAITLVVLGHAILDAGAVLHGGQGLVNMGPFWVPLATASNIPLSLLYSFHMPLFAFVSGLVMWPRRNHPLGAGIVSRSRSLLVPYLAWFVVLYAVNWSPHPTGGFGPALVDAVVGRGGLWYLYALFICLVVMLCLARAPGSRWVLPASAMVAVACSTGLIFRIPEVLYLSSVLWIYPFAVLGYMVGSLRTQFLEHRLPIVATSAVAFLPLFYLRQPVDVPSLQPITTLAATVRGAGIGGGHALGLLISVLVPSLPYACAATAVIALYGLYLGRGGRAIDAQAWLGRKSLGIYAMHGPVVWWLASHGVRDIALLTLLSLGVSAMSTALIERTPLLGSVLLGQRIERAGERLSPSEA